MVAYCPCFVYTKNMTSLCPSLTILQHITHIRMDTVPLYKLYICYNIYTTYTRAPCMRSLQIVVPVFLHRNGPTYRTTAMAKVLVLEGWRLRPSSWRPFTTAVQSLTCSFAKTRKPICSLLCLISLQINLDLFCIHHLTLITLLSSVL